MKWVTTPRCFRPVAVVMQLLQRELDNSVSVVSTLKELFLLHSIISLSAGSIYSVFMLAARSCSRRSQDVCHCAHRTQLRCFVNTLFSCTIMMHQFSIHSPMQGCVASI